MSVVTDRQREELLKLMAKHSELAHGFCHPYDRTKVWAMWKKFAKRLNSLGAGTTGCKKTAQKWRHYWADLKSKARRKRANDEPLCDFDLRLLDLAGEADGKRKPKRVSRVGASRLAVPSSPRREAISTDSEEPRLESTALQEVSSSSQSATTSTNTELIQLMARIEEKQEEAEVRAGASSSRLLAVMRRQLAVQEQQIACLQQIVDKLLAKNEQQ